MSTGLFEPYHDPVSGVTSYLLKRRVAPLQQSFYFVNNPWSADGRYLWFYCAAPPAAGRWLGVIDMLAQTVHDFPETAFLDASPMVDGEGTAYWTTESAVWRRGPQPGAKVELVNEMPAELVGHGFGHNVPARYVIRLATHLSMSADRRGVLIDAWAGRENIVGQLPLDGSPFELWHRGPRCFNHGQMSPHDPDLALLAWDWATDPVSGDLYKSDNRLWLMRRGKPIAPLFPEPVNCTHEWWDRDGEHVWFVGHPRPLRTPDGREADNAAWRVRLSDLRLERMCDWFWHAHDSPCGRYIVGDRRGEMYRGTPSSVHLVDRANRREVAIISRNPEHITPGRQYHIDPHPRFSECGRFITHTTTVRGQVDVAVTRLCDIPI